MDDPSDASAGDDDSSGVDCEPEWAGTTSAHANTSGIKQVAARVDTIIAATRHQLEGDAQHKHAVYGIAPALTSTSPTKGQAAWPYAATSSPLSSSPVRSSESWGQTMPWQQQPGTAQPSASSFARFWAAHKASCSSPAKTQQAAAAGERYRPISPLGLKHVLDRMAPVSTMRQLAALRQQQDSGYPAGRRPGSPTPLPASCGLASTPFSAAAGGVRRPLGSSSSRPGTPVTVALHTLCRGHNIAPLVHDADSLKEVMATGRSSSPSPAGSPVCGSYHSHSPGSCSPPVPRRAGTSSPPPRQLVCCACQGQHTLQQHSSCCHRCGTCCRDAGCCSAPAGCTGHEVSGGRGAELTGCPCIKAYKTGHRDGLEQAAAGGLCSPQQPRQPSQQEQQWEQEPPAVASPPAVLFTDRPVQRQWEKQQQQQQQPVDAAPAPPSTHEAGDSTRASSVRAHEQRAGEAQAGDPIASALEQLASAQQELLQQGAPYDELELDELSECLQQLVAASQPQHELLLQEALAQQQALLTAQHEELMLQEAEQLHEEDVVQLHAPAMLQRLPPHQQLQAEPQVSLQAVAEALAAGLPMGSSSSGSTGASSFPRQQRQVSAFQAPHSGMTEADRLAVAAAAAYDAAPLPQKTQQQQWQATRGTAGARSGRQHARTASNEQWQQQGFAGSSGSSGAGSMRARGVAPAGWNGKEDPAWGGSKPVMYFMQAPADNSRTVVVSPPSQVTTVIQVPRLPDGGAAGAPVANQPQQYRTSSSRSIADSAFSVRPFIHVSAPPATSFIHVSSAPAAEVEGVQHTRMTANDSSRSSMCMPPQVQDASLSLQELAAALASPRSMGGINANIGSISSRSTASAVVQQTAPASSLHSVHKAGAATRVPLESAQLALADGCLSGVDAAPQQHAQQQQVAVRCSFARQGSLEPPDSNEQSRRQSLTFASQAGRLQARASHAAAAAAIHTCTPPRSVSIRELAATLLAAPEAGGPAAQAPAMVQHAQLQGMPAPASPLGSQSSGRRRSSVAAAAAATAAALGHSGMLSPRASTRPLSPLSIARSGAVSSRSSFNSLSSSMPAIVQQQQQQQQHEEAGRMCQQQPVSPSTHAASAVSTACSTPTGLGAYVMHTVRQEPSTPASDMGWKERQLQMQQQLQHIRSRGSSVAPSPRASGLIGLAGSQQLLAAAGRSSGVPAPQQQHGDRSCSDVRPRVHDASSLASPRRAAAAATPPPAWSHGSAFSAGSPARQRPSEVQKQQQEQPAAAGVAPEAHEDSAVASPQQGVESAASPGLTLTIQGLNLGAAAAARLALQQQQQQLTDSYGDEEEGVEFILSGQVRLSASPPRQRPREATPPAAHPQQPASSNMAGGLAAPEEAGNELASSSSTIHRFDEQLLATRAAMVSAATAAGRQPLQSMLSEMHAWVAQMETMCSASSQQAQQLSPHRGRPPSAASPSPGSPVQHDRRRQQLARRSCSPTRRSCSSAASGGSWHGSPDKQQHLLRGRLHTVQDKLQQLDVKMHQASAMLQPCMCHGHAPPHATKSLSSCCCQADAKRAVLVQRMCRDVESLAAELGALRDGLPSAFAG